MGGVCRAEGSGDGNDLISTGEGNDTFGGNDVIHSGGQR
jgi:hypothetical protein